MTTLGKTTVTGVASGATAVYVIGTNYQTSLAGLLDSLHLYFSVVGDDCRVGIYDLASNSQTAEPVNLLYGSAIFTPAVDWNQHDIAVGSKPDLDAVMWYHLCFRVGGNTNRMDYLAGGVANSGRTWATYTDLNEAWKNPYGVGATKTAVQWTIYGTYTPSAGGKVFSGDGLVSVTAMRKAILSVVGLPRLGGVFYGGKCPS